MARMARMASRGKRVLGVMDVATLLLNERVYGIRRLSLKYGFSGKAQPASSLHLGTQRNLRRAGRVSPGSLGVWRPTAIALPLTSVYTSRKNCLPVETGLGSGVASIPLCREIRFEG